MKKQLFLFLASVMLIVAVAVSVFATQVFAAQNIVYGDITDDSYVGVTDVIKLLQLLANDGIPGLAETQKKAMDVNCDNRVDVSDCIRILQYIASPDSTLLGPEVSDEITITAGEISGRAGETVIVPITIENNTGIAGATITVTYSPKLTLTGASNGTAFGAFDFTHTNGLPNPCVLTWDSQSGEVTSDGVIANLTFVIPDTAKIGDKYEVKCSYRHGDIYNNNWDDLTLTFVDGIITVK